MKANTSKNIKNVPKRKKNVDEMALLGITIAVGAVNNPAIDSYVIFNVTLNKFIAIERYIKILKYVSEMNLYFLYYKFYWNMPSRFLKI